MGITIHHAGHVGGPKAEQVVDDIISQTEQAMEMDGVPAQDRWKIDGPPKEDMLRKLNYFKASSLKRSMPIGWTVERYLGNTKRAIPDTVEPDKEKGICADLHNEAETFCLRFVNDKNSDKWYEPGEYTKTQYAPQSVHVQICEYLKDAKRKVQAQGGFFIINDEGNFCDDDFPQGDTKTLANSMEENGKMIMSAEQAAKTQFGPDQVISGQDAQTELTPDGHFKSGLDNWIALRGSPDVCLRVSPKGIRIKPKIQKFPITT